MRMNIIPNEIRILLGALVTFFLSLLYMVASFLPPFHLFYLNYSFMSLSGGLLLLSLRRYNLRKDKNPIIKSKLLIRFIFPLLIIIDCALFYAYFINEKIIIIDGVQNIKEYYGIYLLIVSFWIGIITLLKIRRKTT